MPPICLIPIDLERSRLGLPARINDDLAGAAVLQHTVRRAAAIPQVHKIVLVHPDGQQPLSLLNLDAIDKPVETFADPNGLADKHTPRWVAARKWAPTAWRGGLGAATSYDELLPAGPLADAMTAHHVESAYIVRGDWCLFDPNYAEHQLAIHLEHPDAMKLVFTQAPPGLSGIATHVDVLRQLAQTGAGIGQALGYNPHKPAIDPIGREVNHPIPASVRDCHRRFIYDTPRAIGMIRAIADQIDITRATAQQIATASESEIRLPQQVTVELTPRRPATGPITPQHYADFQRPDLDIDLARRLFAQLEPDTALLLGGLGDAMLHPQLSEIVLAAHEAGALGVGVETDLLCDRDELAALLDLPLDLITVRLNADTAETYRGVMGVDAFNTVTGNLQWLFNERQRRGQALPWIIPRLVKTAETLADMESFFERWMRAAGHAVIEPARCGCGLMPDMSPVPMSPPRREPCRQLPRRMTVLSDGTVAQCDQDWLGRGALGDAKAHGLDEIWSNAGAIADAHKEGRFAELTLCGGCAEWHRP